MTTSKNRRSRRGGARRPKRAFTALASGIVAASLWWLSSAGPEGDSIRAGIALPEWPAAHANPLLAPLRGSAFQLKHVEFLGLEKLSAALLADALALDSTPLVDIDPAAACARLAQREPRVARCSAIRLPFTRMVFSVRERHPLARLEGSATGIDSERVAFELAPGESAALPVLSGAFEPAFGALEHALAAGLAVRAVRAERADDVSLELRDSAVRLRFGSDPARGIAGWRALLTKLSPRELGASEVDTRYRGRVILRAVGAQPPGAQGPAQRAAAAPAGAGGD